VDILKEEASNSDSSGHNDMVQWPHRPSRAPKNVSIITAKTTEIVSHGYAKVKFDVMVVASLKSKGFVLSLLVCT